MYYGLKGKPNTETLNSSILYHSNWAMKKRSFFVEHSVTFEWPGFIRFIIIMGVSLLKGD